MTAPLKHPYKPMVRIDPNMVHIVTNSVSASDKIGTKVAKKAIRVSAPLPDGFGVSLENEISQPFANFIPQGPIETFVAIKNLSVSAGFAISKFFTGVSQPDISFEMSFVAKEDAFVEVACPVIALYKLSAARRANLPDSVSEVVASFANMTSAFATGAINTGTAAASVFNSNITATNFKSSSISSSDVSNFLYWLSGPPWVTVIFGNVYTVERCIVASLEPHWSNNLDPNGIPLQCSVDVTVSLRDPYLADRLPASMVSGFGG